MATWRKLLVWMGVARPVAERVEEPAVPEPPLVLDHDCGPPARL